MSDPSTPSAAGIAGFAAPDRARSQLLLRAVFAASCVLMIALFGFVIGIGVGVSGTDLTMLLLALATFVIACIPLVLDQARAPDGRHVFMALVSLIYMCHFVVPALMLYIPATGPIDASSTSNTNLMPPDIVNGQMMALLGLVSMLVAYAMPIGAAAAQMLPRPRYDWSLLALMAVSLVMLGVGWLVSLVSIFGIIPAEAGTGVVGVIGSWRIYATVLLTYAYLKHGAKLAAALVAVNLLLLFALGLATSMKLDMLIGPAVVVLTSMVLTKKIRARWVVAGFLAIIVVYPVSLYVRDDVLRGASVADLVADPAFTFRIIVDFVSSGDIGTYFEAGFNATALRLDGLGIASVIVRDTPDISPFQYGRTLWLFFIAFVPRIFWPGKPAIHIGQWITDVYGSGPHIEANTAPTPVGEFYLNFGIAGVVVGLAMLGAVLRLGHEALSRRGVTAPSILAQVVLLMIFGLQFQAAAAGVYSQVAFTLISILLVHLAVRTFTRTVPLSGHAVPTSPGL